MAPKDPKQKESNDGLALELLSAKDKKTYLSRKLRAIDDKHETAKNWITDNEKPIVIGYQQMVKAVKDAQDHGHISELIDLIKANSTPSQNVAGLILDIPHPSGKRFYEIIEETLLNKTSKNAKALKALIETTPLGVPPEALSFIDKEADSDIEDTKKLHAEQANQKSGWWKNMSGGTKKDIMKELQDVKSDILDLEMHPSHAKAMVKSYFSYLEAATLDEHTQNYTQDKDPEIDHLMMQFKDAEYQVNLAQHDFNETLTAFTDQIVDLTTSYNDLCDYVDSLSNATSQSAIQLSNIIEKCPDFAKASDWISNEHGMTRFFDLISEAMGETPTPLLFDQLSALEQYADVTVTTNQSDAKALFEAALKVIATHRTVESETSAHEQNEVLITRVITPTIKSFTKSKTPTHLAKILDETDALKTIYESDLDDDNKLLLLQTFIQFANPAFAPTNITKALISMKAMEYKDFCTAIKTFSLAELGHKNKSFIDVYAVIKILKPNLDIAQTALDNADQNLSSLLFIGALQNGLNTKAHTVESVSQVLENAAMDDSWLKILPAYYDFAKNEFSQSDDDKNVHTDLIKDALYATHDGQRLIDIAFKDKDAKTLATVLSFLETPVARSNFLREVATNTKDKKLKDSYIQVADALDNKFLEFNDGNLINTEKLTNLYYHNNTISFLSDGSVTSIPNPVTPYEARDIFLSLLARDNFVLVGNEVLNTDKISYLTHETNKSGEDQLVLLSNGQKVVIELAHMSLENALNSIEEKNTSLIKFGADLIDPSTVSYAYFDDDILNVISENKCVLSVECDPNDKKGIVNAFLNTGLFGQVGNHLINARNIDLLEYDDATQEITIISGEATYKEGQRIPMFNQDLGSLPLPAIKSHKASAEHLMAFLGDQGHTRIANTLTNPDRLVSICRSDAVITLNLSKIDLAIDVSNTDNARKAVSQLQKDNNLDQLDNQYFNTARAQNMWLSDDSQNIHVVIDGRKFETPALNKQKCIELFKQNTNLVATGTEFFDPDAAGYLFTAQNNESQNKIIKTSFSAKSTEITAVNASQVVNTIVSNAIKQSAGEESKFIIDTHSLSAQAAQSSISSAADMAKIRDRKEAYKTAPQDIVFGENYKTKAMSSRDKTPLELAASKGHIGVVKHLLREVLSMQSETGKLVEAFNKATKPGALSVKLSPQEKPKPPKPPRPRYN